MTRTVKNLPASVHVRLKNIAKAQGRPFQEVFYFYAIERFLYRFSQSQHANTFILKGGLMFLCWGLSHRRPTRDIDVQGLDDFSGQDLEDIVKDICAKSVEPDGMQFDPATVQGEPIIQVAEAQGTRVYFVGYLGKAPIRLRVDFSFTNPIVPPDTLVEYPTLLEVSSFQLRGYPFETLIAEKLQSMVVLGRINDRLKDFYDIWLLSQQVDIRGKELTDAITTVFQARQTSFPTSTPVFLSDDFAQEKQQAWARFWTNHFGNTLDVTGFYQVIFALRDFLLPALKAASGDRTYNDIWKAGQRWISSA